MGYSNIQLYRRRFIPNELKLLKDDRILYLDDERIITAWNTLKPRSDFTSGISVYYRREGYKISAHYDADGNFTRWYCDIILEENPAENQIIFHDLLIDVVIYPDGSVRIVDFDEAADALEKELITPDMLSRALRSTDKLLHFIYQNRLSELTECLSAYTK